MRIETFLLTALCFSTVTAFAAGAQPPLWSDLSDIAQYAPKAMPDAALILSATQSDARFTRGARFQFGLKLMDAPQPLADGSVRYSTAAMMTAAGGQLIYRKFLISVGGQPRQILGVTSADIPLNRMHFSATVGLVHRMVLVEDAADDVHLAFPLGVGGLDEAVMESGNELLTPLFRGAHLDREHVNPAGPDIYRGLPIMYITNSRGVTDAIAFHITIITNDEARRNGLNFLRRGFESHACMRLRLKDLNEFHTVLFHAADSRLPVNVDYFIWNADSRGVRDKRLGVLEQVHPYPFNDGSYMSVIYFPESPHYKIGPDQVVEMGRRKGQPNLAKLSAFDALDQQALKTFLARKAEMDGERIRDGIASAQ